MDGFILFLIFIFVVVPVMKNIFGSSKTSKKPTRTKQTSWEQNLKGLKYELENMTNNSGSDNRTGNGHPATRYQTHLRTHKRSQNQIDRDKQRVESQKVTHQYLENLQTRKSDNNIVQVSNESVDTWGKRGDSRKGGGLIFLILFALIAFLGVSKVAPDLWPDIMQALNIR